MRIAVFADVHGRVELCFKLCQRWERETRQHLDYILQAGDLGAFFDHTRLDKATIRHAQHDPSELGFLVHFTTYHEPTAALLGETTCPLLFVRGNHEDHETLDRLERQYPGPAFPVDVYQRVWCLKSGVRHQLTAQQAILSLLGIGRVGPVDGETDLTKAKYVQPYEQESIYRLGPMAIDVLLTHDSARHAVTRGYGMAEIRDVLDSYRPSYHFYGHTEEPYYQRRDGNGTTLACKLSDLTWDMERGGMINVGSMAILTWNGRSDTRLEIVDTAWFREYSRYSWAYL